MSTIGAAGYCWGGEYHLFLLLGFCSIVWPLILWRFGLLSIVCLLSHSAKVVAELAKAREIQAAVMSHPSFVTVDDIKGLFHSSEFWTRNVIFLLFCYKCSLLCNICIYSNIRSQMPDLCTWGWDWPILSSRISQAVRAGSFCKLWGKCHFQQLDLILVSMEV